jgi:hypothetical protein
MDNKVITAALVSVIVALLSWNIKTTNELQLQNDAFSK